MSNNYTRVTRSDGGGKFMIFVVWIVLSGALVLVLLPCCIYRRFRIIYCRRIRQRRWNVSTDDIEPDPRPFMRRYPRSDPRHVASAEDAEHAKKEYILGKLKDFTKTIEEADFTTKQASDVDVESKKSRMFWNPRHPSLLGNLFRMRSRPSGEKNDESDHDAPAKEEIVSQDKDVEEEGEIVPQFSGDTFHTISSNLSSAELLVDKLHVDNNHKSIKELPSSTSTVVVLELPCPGISFHDATAAVSSTNNESPSNNNDSYAVYQKKHMKFIIPECPICLNECKVGENISWSPQRQCFHAFHKDCILQWFLTLGRNADERRRAASYDVDFKMCCPVCRQDFIPDEETSNSGDNIPDEEASNSGDNIPDEEASNSGDNNQ